MSSSLPILQSAFTSLEALPRQSEEWQDRILGAICFIDSIASAAIGLPAGMPVMQVGTRIIKGAETACEIWLSNAPLQQGYVDGLRYRHNDQLLFGVLEVAEPQTGSGMPLQQATEQAYTRILALLGELDYPFIYRFWNYLADINGDSQILERYRQFNLGRQDALLASGQQIAGELPAACTLGIAQGPLSIAFLAGRIKATSIENPRQVNAYQYPEQYGPRSPTFSRANLLQLAGQEILFISGTASIVGHETVHPGDATAQTQEAMTNLQRLLDEAEARTGRKLNTQDMLYRVYVRNAADLEPIQHEMRRMAGPGFRAIFVQADICRKDLLLEIEATVGQPTQYI
jgi:enamine deaminase RidA (YjgF/YER057c/UK114 family)